MSTTILKEAGNSFYHNFPIAWDFWLTEFLLYTTNNLFLTVYDTSYIYLFYQQIFNDCLYNSSDSNNILVKICIRYPTLMCGESICHPVMSDLLWPSRILCPWNSPCKNTGVGYHTLLQGIFPTQESNPGVHTAGGFFTIWATRKLPL